MRYTFLFLMPFFLLPGGIINQDLANTKIDDYKEIWLEPNQKYKFGEKNPTALALSYNACKTKEIVTVKSPDNQYAFNLKTDKGFAYSVTWKGEKIIDVSELGFEFKDGTRIGDGIEIIKIERVTHDEDWKPIYGERNVYPDHYNESLVHLACKTWEGKFSLRIRAYKEGVAFRYEFNSEKKLEVDRELTEFSYPGDPFVWTSKFAQSEIEKQKLSDLTYVAERPLLAELSDSVYTVVGEAALVDFARMKFKKHDSKKHVLFAELDKGKNGEYPIIITAKGYSTPWRYIMAGTTPAEILQNNYLLLNLNEENKITDPHFIKPGKVIREVTLTTQGGLACIDFAARYKLQFIEFDAGWYGPEGDESSDATTVTVDPKRSPGPLDLPYVMKYAEEKGIGVILYINRRALQQQIDEVLPLVKSWGVAGLKYGFVNVGPQKWTAWLHDAVKKAAGHELMVDIHDEYRPTGVSRTYPNLMTQEGIRGDETRITNDGVINTIFTRMVAGAGDQTNCYFAERVDQEMGSHASQMAKTICIYSPWQFLYWYDRPPDSPANKGGAGNHDRIISEIEDLRFFEQVPTVWDDTKVIEGYPGKYVAIARRKADNWYLGAIAGTEPYNLVLQLDFLDEDKKYKATIFSDDASLNTRTSVDIREMEADNQKVLSQSIQKQNGLAVIFTPLD